MTHGEFKAASLSAYERGERVISVLRLVRLAAIYQTAFVDLVPAIEQSELEPLARAAADARRRHPDETGAGATPLRVRFDMVRLAELDGPGWEQARNVLAAIQQRRRGRPMAARLDLRRDGTRAGAGARAGRGRARRLRSDLGLLLHLEVEYGPVVVARPLGHSGVVGLRSPRARRTVATHELGRVGRVGRSICRLEKCRGALVALPLLASGLGRRRLEGSAGRRRG
ncbi:MAG: hypothetical protein ACYCXY_13375, partial [Acidimicrobiales bacterium]